MGDETDAGGGDSDQLPLECAAGQHIEIGVDSLMRDVHRRLVRIPLRQPACNLFGRPALREQGKDCGTQAELNCQLPWITRVVRPALDPLMGTHRPIGDGRGVLASEFTRHGTRGSAQGLSDGSEARSTCQHATQFLAF